MRRYEISESNATPPSIMTGQSRSNSLLVMSSSSSTRLFSAFVKMVMLIGLLVPLSVQSFSTGSSTSSGSNASRKRQHVHRSPQNTEAETECDLGDPILNSNIVGEENKQQALDVDLETRRMFVGLIVTGVGSSLLGARPGIASAKEPSSTNAVAKIDSSNKLLSAKGDPSIESTQLLSDASAVDWNSIFKKASKRALGGGKAGASAAVIQVLSLMWLRTSMNRQYRYGGDLKSSLNELWKEGGIPRLYQGLPFALVQGPLTRFGDTAANVGILVLLESFPETQTLPLAVKTGLGSITAGLWRIFLMPIDSSKTAMQVEGKEGLKELLALVNKEGPGPLYNGALAQAAATAAGHFPWFLTYNYVDEILPLVTASDDLLLSLVRSAFLGLCASSVSDITSNSLRVIKTTKQTARLGSGMSDIKNDKVSGDGEEQTTIATSEVKKEISDDVSYGEVVQIIIKNDGLAGLFGRGLKTRLLTNAIQGSLFSVLFKYFQQN